MIVTLPFQELIDRFGPVPDGIDLQVWDLEAPHETPDEVAMVLTPFFFRGGRRWGYLEQLTNLQLLQLPSAGYEHAIGRTPERAKLANGRGIHDDETAELAVGLALTSLRELDRFALDRAAGRWDPHTTRALADRRVLVLGYGAIGSAIAQRFEAFRTTVTVVARTAREQDGRQVHGFDELESLVPDADVLVIIAPLTDETTKLVDGPLLALLPDGALVVNVARGAVVDTDALVQELQTERLFAGLDVTDPEPLPDGHPLWTTPNTVLTPHVGGNTHLSVPRTVDLMRKQVTALAAGEPFENIVG